MYDNLYKMLRETKTSVNEPELQTWELHCAPKVTNMEAYCALSECPDKAHFYTSESHYQLAAVGP